MDHFIKNLSTGPAGRLIFSNEVKKRMNKSMQVPQKFEIIIGFPVSSGLSFLEKS